MIEARRPRADISNDRVAESSAPLSRPLLLDEANPPTVPRLVPSVAVDTVDGQARRPRAHVGKECGEVVIPLIADHDPATSVVSVRPVARVVASAFHGHPCSELRRFHPDGMPMGNACVLGQACEAHLPSLEASPGDPVNGGTVWAFNRDAISLAALDADLKNCDWAEFAGSQTFFDGEPVGPVHKASVITATSTGKVDTGANDMRPNCESAEHQ